MSSQPGTTRASSGGHLPESLLRKRMPELDFWRGIAIGWVLLYHAVYWTENRQPNQLANWLTQLTLFGWLGVNLFFVLSGFLITGILLDSKDRPGYFRSFYGRRVKRILPAYALCLFGLVLLRLISVGGLLRAVTFTANYSLIPASRTYGPLWSLSVEEQFYLAWPILVLLVNRRRLAKICVAICIAEPLLRYFAWAQHSSNSAMLIHVGTLFVADSLALGALCAIYFRSRWAGRKSAVLLCLVLVAISTVTLIAGWPYGVLHRRFAIGAALQVVPFNLIFAATIIASIAFRPASLSARITRPVRAMGDISYGLYLCHLMVFSEYDRFFPVHSYYGRFGALLLRTFVCLTVAIAIAWLSRWKFEEIFLRKKTTQSGQRAFATSQTSTPPTCHQSNAERVMVSGTLSELEFAGAEKPALQEPLVQDDRESLIRGS